MTSPTQPDTILTKWGRITAQEWIRRRFIEGMEERFDAACLAYLDANWPTTTTPLRPLPNRQTTTTPSPSQTSLL